MHLTGKTECFYWLVPNDLLIPAEIAGFSNSDDQALCIWSGESQTVMQRIDELFHLDLADTERFYRDASQSQEHGRSSVGQLHFKNPAQAGLWEYVITPLKSVTGKLGLCSFKLLSLDSHRDPESGIWDSQWEKIKANVGWEKADRIRSEGERKELSSILTAIVANMPVIVIRVDGRGIVTQCFGAGLSKLDLRNDASVGSLANRAFPGLQECWKNALSGLSVSQSGVQVLPYREVFYDIWAFPAHSSAKGVTAVCIEVSARVQALAALKQGQDRLEERVVERTRALQEEVQQRREVERKLRDHQARIDLLLMDAPAVLWTVDTDLRFTSSLGAGLEMIHLEPNEVIGWTLQRFFQTDDPEYMPIRMHKRALRGERGTFQIEFMDRTMIAHVAPLRDGHDRIIGCVGVSTDVSDLRRLEKELLEIRERELQRIGQDLHDDLGQQLTGISFLLKVLRQRIEKSIPEETAYADELGRLVQQTISHTRALARGFSAIDLERGGLRPALIELARSIENVFHVPCQFQALGTTPNLPLDISTHLYRLAQEALQNSVKHGKPSKVKIQLKSLRDRLVLALSDDGCGMAPNFEESDGMGLRIMSYRANQIGSKLEIGPNPGGGLRVMCTVPFGDKYSTAKASQIESNNLESKNQNGMVEKESAQSIQHSPDEMHIDNEEGTAR